MSLWTECKNGLMKAEVAVDQALDVCDAAEEKMVKRIRGTSVWSKCKGIVTKVTTSKSVNKAKVATVKAKVATVKAKVATVKVKVATVKVIDLSKPIPMCKPLPVVKQAGPVTIYTYIDVR